MGTCKINGWHFINSYLPSNQFNEHNEHNNEQNTIKINETNIKICSECINDLINSQINGYLILMHISNEKFKISGNNDFEKPESEVNKINLIAKCPKDHLLSLNHNQKADFVNFKMVLVDFLRVFCDKEKNVLEAKFDEKEWITSLKYFQCAKMEDFTPLCDINEYIFGRLPSKYLSSHIEQNPGNNGNKSNNDKRNFYLANGGSFRIVCDKFPAFFVDVKCAESELFTFSKKHINKLIDVDECDFGKTCLGCQFRNKSLTNIFDNIEDTTFPLKSNPIVTNGTYFSVECNDNYKMVFGGFIVDNGIEIICVENNFFS